jgi:UPF0755 protein
MSEEKKAEASKMSKSAKKKYIYDKLVEQQSEARLVRRIVLAAAIFLILFAGAAGVGGYYYINKALQPVDETNTKEVNVEIPIGSTVTGIGQILEDNGIIRDARLFRYYVKFRNESGFMAGEYKLNPSMTIPEVITSLKTGTVMQDVVMRITIPEGKQLTQIAGIIAEKTNGSQDEIMNKLNGKEFLSMMMDKYPDLLTEDILDEQIKYPLEGYLFPATYPFYTENPTLEEIVTTMLNKTRSVVEEYKAQGEEKGFSVHELLTMASLIEEEATQQVDRAKISSVFYNRMETGMPLQTDPTVLYAQGEHKDRVYHKDLKFESPYNTYLHKGLPPGPIANAGASSLEAAVNPEDTDLFYFLATPEGNVLFSRTFEEHSKLVAEHITNQ